MSHGSCSLLDCGQAEDLDQDYTMDDYEGPRPRWCPGCGDFGVLTAARRLLEAHQLRPERTVFVSGIGCSSRFPHYLTTYGFHGIHGRALPIATGVKLSRPELDVFVVMGDGDCCSIGAGHWVHAIRYNVDMVVLLLDNNIYGLTKNQTSPTTPQGLPSNTQPRGSYLPPLNPISVTLGVTNASFVAQTADWMPSHLFATLDAAYRHDGLSFVRILQRCPKWTPGVFAAAVMNPDNVEILTHENGIDAEGLGDYRTRIPHDPLDLDGARGLADETAGKVRLGLFYANEALPRYEETRHLPVYTAEEKIEKLNLELDRYAV
jgi:2-oxoglutarate ferredoxin oxidoreductase subunit beta